MTLIKILLKLFCLYVIVYGTLLYARINNNKESDMYYVQSYYFYDIKFDRLKIMFPSFVCGGSAEYARHFSATVPGKDVPISGWVCERGLFIDNKFLKLD